MAKCRNCNREISRLDSDLCPYCGMKDPIDKDYRTMDITRNINPVSGEFDLYKSRKRKTALLLCALLGFLGVHDFYLYRPKRGLLCLLATIVLVGGIGSLLFFLAWRNPLSYLLPFFAEWLFFLVLGVFIFRSDTLKDGRGEFLR